MERAPKADTKHLILVESKFILETCLCCLYGGILFNNHRETGWEQRMNREIGKNPRIFIILLQNLLFSLLYFPFTLFAFMRIGP